MPPYTRFGGFNDYRAAGKDFQGRITVGLVMAGAIAKKLLSRLGIEVLAHTVQIGPIKIREMTSDDIRKNVYQNPVSLRPMQLLLIE